MKSEKQEKPLIFKRSIVQNTASVLHNTLAIMSGSAAEKVHRERLQSAILKVFPESSEGERLPEKETRVLEIDRRQMFALIYGMTSLVNNIDAKKSELSVIWSHGFDYFSLLKKLSESVGIWNQVLELIKPDSSPEWDKEFSDDLEGNEPPGDSSEIPSDPGPVTP